MQKTNKSFTKRLKVTKNKKIIRRSAKQDHFNAKQTGDEKRAKSKTFSIASVDYKNTRKFMPFS